ncbi:hypothetical protein KAI58_03310 [Candidatus Gracilibacteria bacterium]|nr:hypothetical protein [Candidatus Gracilibacteria bacterium]
MKKLLILVFSLSLIGCNTPQEIGAPLPEIESNTVKTASIGEICGGIDGIICQSGLNCQIEEKHPNANGICVNPIVNENLKCPETQAPVCGLKNDNKNGYLNECEATRHGAEILYDGFCKKDETVSNNCTGKVLGIEGCDTVFTAVEFNGSDCVVKTVQGCDVEIPFETIEACENSCLKDEEKSSISAKNETTLIQKCPTQKIINKMPMIISSPEDMKKFPARQYFIYNGSRMEIEDFDASFLKANCTIPEMVVH